jgi:hypothetical protein
MACIAGKNNIANETNQEKLGINHPNTFEIVTPIDLETPNIQ